MTIDELDEEVRTSFLAGYHGDGPQAEETPQVAANRHPVPSAYLEGLELRQARELLLSASVAEYPSDKARYDTLGPEINIRYGRIVVLSGEPGFPGLRTEEGSDAQQ
jgi:hypothetical protein